MIDRMSRTTRCQLCGEDVDPDGPRTVRQLTAYAENNKSGKPSKLVEWAEVGPAWHWYCWERRKPRGGEQQSMF